MYGMVDNQISCIPPLFSTLFLGEPDLASYPLVSFIAFFWKRIAFSALTLLVGCQEEHLG